MHTTYHPLFLPQDTPNELRHLVKDVFDTAFKEVRFLLRTNTPDSNEKGSLQISIAVLLLALADSAAQLFDNSELDNKNKFIHFMNKNYPWDLDPPDALNIQQACEWLWDARCSLVHRRGLSFGGNRKKYKIGRIHSQTENSLLHLEQLKNMRPYSEGSVGENDDRIIFWLDGFYWGLRITIENVLNNSENQTTILEHLKSGKWDKKHKKEESSGSLP